MESLYSRRSNLIIGFHGCDASVVRKVVNGEEDLIPSTNDYDWLGNGIYFWENNEARALQWATELSKRKGSSIKKPAVVGAIIDLGYCFDLMDSTYLQELPKRTISRYASAILTASRVISFQEALTRHIPIHSNTQSN